MHGCPLPSYLLCVQKTVTYVPSYLLPMLWHCTIHRAHAGYCIPAASIAACYMRLHTRNRFGFDESNPYRIVLTETSRPQNPTVAA